MSLRACARLQSQPAESLTAYAKTVHHLPRRRGPPPTTTLTIPTPPKKDRRNPEKSFTAPLCVFGPCKLNLSSARIPQFLHKSRMIPGVGNVSSRLGQWPEGVGRQGFWPYTNSFRVAGVDRERSSSRPEMGAPETVLGANLNFMRRNCFIMQFFRVTDAQSSKEMSWHSSM